jgi:hypothetical protein
VRFVEGLEPGSAVAENQSLVLLYDVKLETKLVQLTQEIAAAQQEINSFTKQINAAISDATTPGTACRHTGGESTAAAPENEVVPLAPRSRDEHHGDGGPGGGSPGWAVADQCLPRVARASPGADHSAPHDNIPRLR